jgi:hypothetical protein
MRPLRQYGVTGITAGGGSVLPRRIVLREVMRQPDVLMRRCCAGLLDMTALRSPWRTRDRTSPYAGVETPTMTLIVLR